MIARSARPRSIAARPVARWQRELGRGAGSVGELLDLLGLPPELLPGGVAAARDFPLRVPRGFVARMRPGDPRDPLLLQVLPAAEELASAPGFGADPVGEGAVAPVAGVLHKYRGRALVVVTGACGVHCRYCFRRHFPYAEQAAGADWRRAVAYVAGERSVEEVILSGGDPLTLRDERLSELAAALAEVPHVRRLRVHTRLPVVLPERLDGALLEWLGGTRLQPVLVLHANHPREIGAELAAGVTALRQAGVTVLNQAVLLRGVNDAVGTLCELSTALFAAGILPYYLHLLDRVAGAAHFEVPEGRARELHRGVMERLPGYLVPRLVREVAGAPCKLPV